MYHIASVLVLVTMYMITASRFSYTIFDKEWKTHQV